MRLREVTALVQICKRCFHCGSLIFVIVKVWSCAWSAAAPNRPEQWLRAVWVVGLFRWRTVGLEQNQPNYVHNQNQQELTDWVSHFWNRVARRSQGSDCSFLLRWPASLPKSTGGPRLLAGPGRPQCNDPGSHSKDRGWNIFVSFFLLD